MVFEKLRPHSNLFFSRILSKGTIINPHVLTSLALIAAFGAALSFVFQRPILATALMLLNGLLDILDGRYATLRGGEGFFGSFFDHVVDRISDVLFIAAIGFGGYVDHFWSLFLVCLTLFVSYIGPLGIVVSVGKIAGGVASRADRVILLSIGALLTGFNLQLLGISALAITVYLLIILSGLTVFLRVKKIVSLSKSLG